VSECYFARTVLHCCNRNMSTLCLVRVVCFVVSDRVSIFVSSSINNFMCVNSNGVSVVSCPVIVFLLLFYSNWLVTNTVHCLLFFYEISGV
jgi:hypothetical protein